MALVIRSFKNEWQKLIAHKKYIVFIVLAAVICLCSALFSVLVNAMSRGNVPLNFDNYALKMLGFFIQIYIPLIIFMGVTDLFCSEFNNLSIKAILPRPISRFKIYISKVMAVFAVALANLMSVFVISGIVELIFSGKLTAVNSLFTTFLIYIIDLIPLLVVILLVCFINQLVKSPSLAMFLCILIYVVLKFSYMASGIFSGMVITSYLEWHKLWVGATLPFSSMLSKIMLILGQGIIFLTAGFYLFDKKEL